MIIQKFPQKIISLGFYKPNHQTIYLNIEKSQTVSPQSLPLQHIDYFELKALKKQPGQGLSDSSPFHWVSHIHPTSDSINIKQSPLATLMLKSKFTSIDMCNH